LLSIDPDGGGEQVGTPFLGELRIFSFEFAPRGWAFCDGQTLPINQNQALFALLGTFYGGDGVTTFQLPNLQGRVPVHVGGSLGVTQGEQLGQETHTLTIPELASHTHLLAASSGSTSTTDPTGNVLAASGDTVYTSSGPPSVALSPPSIANAGGGQPHENRQPYLVLNVCIALQGIFPSRN
jgi:microcystin-dependent protein